jgi:hypothetical protein
MGVGGSQGHVEDYHAVHHNHGGEGYHKHEVPANNSQTTPNYNVTAGHGPPTVSIQSVAGGHINKVN